MNEESIFAAAVELKTAAERKAFLDRACGGNSELRSAVEELLKADSDAGSFLHHTPLGLDATVLTGAASKDAEFGHWAASLPFLAACDKPDRIGKLVGKAGEYEIIEVVGQGGMGAVLRAFDTKLSRVVAVKVMAPELAANPLAVKRFLREAQSAAAVHHDHVVTIHAIDDTHRPPFIVMQFVDGQTLQQKIDREGALELKQILRIGSQMAAGLAAAHRHGLIHRDVKPANILLENGVERVKITDFGLARAADDMEMTKTGTIAGTPQYMSPEQAKGESIDHRSDLFSLGGVLYTMCTGRPAFRAETTMGVLKRVCEDPPRPIQEVNAEIPEWLCEIVDKLLDKQPDQRFQSAEEVAGLLAQHLAHLQRPESFPLPTPLGPRAASTGKKSTTALQSEANYFWATGIMSLVAFSLSAMASPAIVKISREAPAPLLTWFFVGGLISLPVGLLIMFCAKRVESRQSLGWALTATVLSLLPINPFLVFCLPISIWSLVTVLRAGGQSRLALEGAVKKPPVAASSSEPRPVPPLWVVGGGLFFAVVAMFGVILKELSLISGRALGLFLVILIFSWLVALAVWLFTHHLRMTRALRENDISAKPSKLTAHGVLIEHPVLGVVAIVMLLVAMGSATYMLTAAWQKSIRDRATIAVQFDSVETTLIVKLRGTDKQVAELSNRLPQVQLRPGKYDLYVLPYRHSYGIEIDMNPSRGLGLDFEARGDHWEIDLGERDRVVISLQSLKHEVTDAPGATAGMPSGASEHGWVQLFNGKDLTGWKTHTDQPGFWKVEEGQLIGFGAVSHLFTDRGDYENFHLRVEAQVNDTGTSGVYFRVPEFAAARYGQFPDGYEANINSTYTSDADKTGSLTGSLRGVASYKSQLHKPDEWFTMEVLAQGQRIVIRVNGETTVDFVDANNSFRRGHLALQVWPAQSVVRFRKIEIKEIASGDTANSASSVSTPRLAIAPFDEQTAKAHQEAWAKHLVVPAEITNSIGMTLRLIPPGTYASDSAGVAESTDPFFLGTCEVTVGQFRRFVGETNYQTTAEKSQLGGSRVQSRKKTERSAEYVWSHPEFAVSDDHPVTQVTWHDATAYCDWLSRMEGRTYRLPKEGEWQWAVRAGSATRFYFGEALSDSDAHAWHLANANDRSQPVRAKLPNPWGLYDMYGNVWELTYVFERGGTAIDPSQATAGPAATDRINFWGGSFSNPLDAPPVRGFGPALVSYSHLGFRVAIVGDLPKGSASSK